MASIRNEELRRTAATRILILASVLVTAGSPVAAGGARPEAEAAMTAPLRHALGVARRPSAAAAAGDDADSLTRTLAKRLSRPFLVRAGDPATPESGPLATFKAILDTGSAEEIVALRESGARIRGRVGTVVSFEAPLLRAEAFAGLPAVRSLDIARRLVPELDVSRAETGAAAVHDPLGSIEARGEGVLMAVIDTGQDLGHADFRTPNRKKRTRFKSLYNMNRSCRGAPPPGHSDGCYYGARRINRYLKEKAKLTYGDPAATLGHGSHVAGIAAGNGRGACGGCPKGVYVGMAPRADLIGVKIFDRNGEFVGDIPEALQFLAEEQARLGNRPLVVNMSFGHQFGAHDGTDPDELAIDAFVQEGLQSGVTRVVVKSAGNAAGGRTYLQGGAAAGATEMYTFHVPGGGPCRPFRGEGDDLAVIDLWYEESVELTVRVTAPDGMTFLENSTGHHPSVSAQETPYGTIFVECPAAPHPLNGDRECVLGVDDTGGIAPAAGVWTVSITGGSVPPPSTGRYDAWLAIAERGDCTWGWDQPSAGHSITLPGTAQEVITVGAYVTKDEWRSVTGDMFHYSPVPVLGDLAAFSSEGPTRDGRPKPDLAAPGMGIASSRARTVPIAAGTEGSERTVTDRKHMILEGTSMAAPHVAGAAALLLSIDPTLDAAQIRALLIGSARQDGFSSGQPNRWGAGKLDVQAAATGLGP